MNNNEKQTEKEKDDNPRLKYKIKKNTPLGKGAFSTVYRAIDKNNNEYALKCIPLHILEKYNKDKFSLELEISMKMKHPNIVKTFDTFDTEKNWYIVSEYCNNGTLSDIIKEFSNRCLSCFEREIICKRYLTQLKNALKYLYKNNIVHRDLKPSNILINDKYPHDILKLADFGFSRYFNSENDTQINLMTSFCGTPLYMAPELLIDKKYDSNADLWSFGIIMYEMMYGCNPYGECKNMIDLLTNVQTNNIEFKSGYSEQCLSLVKSLLKIDASERIDWKLFFKHEWFDKQIPSGFSRDSMGSIDNLTIMDISPDKNNSETFPNTELIDNIKEKNDVNDDDDAYEYDVIDKNELSPRSYKSYNEIDNNTSVIQILSKSIKYWLNMS
ncbi:serine/threonine protein kinase [Bodo saltans virus]|uniref:Serine/threonine protein kinase n=1 Tax=Bodo saltans virus TaxID=2024608 RepID=A0A2H4UU60_9VIRU|nr:serine/threonine protein kinase [Bodo saltans virus]ATZ80470.1 serine/threonine protein kinase [Bodo saltans virus]